MALDDADVGGAAGLIGGDAGAADAGSGGGSGAGGSGDAGAGAGAGAGEGFGSGDAGASPDWFEKVSATAGEGDTPSNRDWLASKGVKDLDALVKSYREAETTIRNRGGVKVPGDGAKPEEIAAFRTAIGVPEKVDGYEVKGPDGVKLNEPLINALRESALKHGAPKGAFEGLVSDFIQSQLDEAATETKRQDDLAAAKIAEWGPKKTENIAHVDAACRKLNLTKADMSGLRAGLGADRALDLLAKLGNGMAEDSLINSGGDRRFGVTGAEAQSELDRLKGDPEFTKKALVKGSPENARWERLNQAAATAAGNAAR